MGVPPPGFCAHTPAWLLSAGGPHQDRVDALQCGAGLHGLCAIDSEAEGQAQQGGPGL